jgi:hypothetical protein
VKVINEEEAMHLSCAFRASNGWDWNNRKHCQTDVYLEESELVDLYLTRFGKLDHVYYQLYIRILL